MKTDRLFKVCIIFIHRIKKSSVLKAIASREDPRIACILYEITGCMDDLVFVESLLRRLAAIEKCFWKLRKEDRDPKNDSKLIISYAEYSIQQMT